MSEAPLLFLDANALASPVTRTLLIAGARADGLRWTWSQHVEIEADRHARGQALRTSVVRKEILGTELSPTASGTDGLAEIHRRLGRRHLRPVARFSSAYDTTPILADLISQARSSGVWPASGAGRTLTTRRAWGTACDRNM